MDSHNYLSNNGIEGISYKPKDSYEFDSTNVDCIKKTAEQKKNFLKFSKRKIIVTVSLTIGLLIAAVVAVIVTVVLINKNNNTTSGQTTISQTIIGQSTLSYTNITISQTNNQTILSQTMVMQSTLSYTDAINYQNKTLLFPNLTGNRF